MNKQFKKGFFEYIAAADAEKVHSQTIGWIFSNECEVFEPMEKHAIIQKILGHHPKDNENFIPQKVDVEINDIDILLTTEKHCLVIENKIKSSQHSNQLFKYEYLTANEELIAWECFMQWRFPEKYKDLRSIKSQQEFETDLMALKLDPIYNKEFKWNTDTTKKQAFYIYLTLIEEEPAGTKNKWIKLSYSKLHLILEEQLFAKERSPSENYFIVKSYLNTINNLSNAARAFVENPDNFDFVFTVGKLPKERLNSDEFQDGTAASYIKMLQLETLLQKWFYSNLLEKIKSKQVDLNQSLKYNLGETHGTGLLDFFFEEISINQNKYIPILQFQGNSIKLALVGSSKKPKSKLINKKVSNAKRQLRKREFSERLAKNPLIYEILNINREGVEELIISEIQTKISTPKNEDGFFSININQGKEYWQLLSHREEFVIQRILQAQQIFQKLNDPLTQ